MATSWRKNPLIYEINTWTWLRALTEQYGREITLGHVPDAELDDLAGWGLDAIWLMGLWERSPAGRQMALEHPGLQEEYRRALPDFAPEDVVGSPYCVRRYAVDAHLGEREELAAIRQQLAVRNLRLVLDFVPNHVATDHPWLGTHAECFVQGRDSDLENQPGYFFRGPPPNNHLIFANGRDPYFPAWTDVAQLNAFSPVLRQKVAATLLDIASQCDAVRCDMAMLVVNRIFAETWGERVGQVPGTEFWEVVIPAVKAEHPGFKFMAEVYWNMEWNLVQQGFDYAYDKQLYDRLAHESVRSINGHLGADLAYHECLIRFIENHDEPRAPTALGAGRDLAAALLIATLPGATLFHEGQFAAHQVKLPVQLGRRPPEGDNESVKTFYHMILDEATQSIYHEGAWRLRESAAAWDLNATHKNLIAYTWRQSDDRRLIVVNYSSSAAQGRVGLPEFGLRGRTWHLHDVLHGDDYERDGDEMDDYGLYVDLRPWQAHVFMFA